MIGDEPLVVYPLIVEAVLVLVAVGLELRLFLVSCSLRILHGQLCCFHVPLPLVSQRLLLLLLPLHDLRLDVAEGCFLSVLLLGSFGSLLGDLPGLAPLIVLLLDVVVFHCALNLRLDDHLLILLGFLRILSVELLELGAVSRLPFSLFPDLFLLQLRLFNNVLLLLLPRVGPSILTPLDVLPELI